MRVEEILLVVRQTPLCKNGSAAADNTGAAFHGQRDVPQQHSRMNREVIDSLLGLLDQGVPIEFPREVFGPPSAFFESLVDGYGSDRHGRIAKDPFAGLMNIAPRRQIH